MNRREVERRLEEEEADDLLYDDDEPEPLSPWVRDEQEREARSYWPARDAGVD